MTDLRHEDSLLRAALAEFRSIEPTHSEVMEVTRRVGAVPVRRRRLRRTVLAVALSFGLIGGSALAVPQTREAIADAFGAFRDFFGGSGDAPGEPVASSRSERLSWFGGTNIATGRVIAQTGEVALIAFRNPSGLACLSYSKNFEECRLETDWARTLSQTTIVVRGPGVETTESGRRRLFGIVADEVRAVDLIYADGSFERTDGVRNGFVIPADPSRRPAELRALNESGNVIGAVDIGDLGWNP